MNQADPSSSPRTPATDETGRSALDWPQRVGAAADVLAELTVLAHRRRRHRQLGIAALATVAVLLTAGVIWHRASMSSSPGGMVASTVLMAPVHRALSDGAVAELAPVQWTLSDGSVVELKEGAHLEVAFTPGVRAVTLQHGTAYFQVAKNQRWPFVVMADGVEVRAVGTAFCVEIESKAVEVITTEGHVAVTQTLGDPHATIPTAPAPGSTLVGSGEHVLVGARSDAAPPPALTVMPLGSQELAKKLDWRNPRLEFAGTPLENVIMMFNHHNQRRLVLDDPALQHLELSGILRADNIEALLQLLETDFHIKAEYHANGEIVLSRAP